MSSENDKWLQDLGVDPDSFEDSTSEAPEGMLVSSGDTSVATQSGEAVETGGQGDDTPAEKTDPSGLVVNGVASVSPDGGSTDEPSPKQGVEYDFCVNVSNAGKSPSGSFFVRFNLSGDQDPPLDFDFKQDDGLDSKGTVQAVVHFGKFANKFGIYHLGACIFSSSNPGTPIRCNDLYDITINSE